MKVLAAGLLVAAALTVTGAAAPHSSTCCQEVPVSDFDPQWSSDGSRIAFIRHASDGLSALFTMAAGGGDERRIVSLGDDYQPNASRQRPLLSPDWTRLALISSTSTLKVMSVDGSDAHEIGTRVGRFAWSPDSRRLAFDQTYADNTSEIFVVESDGSGLRSLGPGLSPAWSPSGDQIAFVSPAGMVYVMQADGSGRRLVYDGHGAVTYLPSWSPLGDRIAFYSYYALVVVATDGTRLWDTFTDYELEPPQWSFDGTLVAVETPPVLSVFRIGTGDHWSFERRRDPSWSPVENELTASFDGRCQPYGIYRMSVAASRRLTLDCHIRGTEGPDVLTGTSLTDIIYGLRGDDELLGGAGPDRLFGGAGDDTLLGGDSGDLLQGGYGADLLIGGNFSQDPYTEVDDVLFGGPGPDDLRGGPGQDNLNGDSGNDVLRGGPDADVLFGGPGNDRILASGDAQEGTGEPVRDIVDCGPGRHDVAYVDRIDGVSGCETIHRR